MINGLYVKPGVRFAPIARAGFRILSALDRAARRLHVDLTITCGSDSHPPADPHTSGEAYDVRTHDWDSATKQLVLREVLLDLCEDGEAPIAADGGLGTRHFWGWIEHPNDPAEHLHVQRRKGTEYA